MFDRIVVAIDGSEHAGKALEIACELARANGSELALVHVVGTGDPPEGLARFLEIEHVVDEAPPSGPDTVADVSTGLAASQSARSAVHRHRLNAAIGERLLERARAQARGAGVKRIRPVLEEGDPSERILAEIGSCAAELVVMGTRGLSRLKGLLMGSTSQKVAQLAGCPCLTVK